MTRLWTRLGFSLIGAFAFACGGAPEVTHSRGDSDAALQPLQTCGEVEAAIRGSALKEMNRQLDQNLKQFVENGGNCWYDDAMAGGGGSGGGANAPTSESGGAKEVSGTNNQVAGVDEADFVKNDNEYIYAVAGGALHIIDAWPAPEAHEIANVKLDGTPKKLFVASDRALVYSSMSKTGQQENPYDPYYGYGSGECTYGYDCDFTGDGNATRVSVFDITNRAAPVLVRQIDLSGSFINARRIGDSIHTVVHDSRQSFEGVGYWPDGLNQCGGAVSPVVAAVAFETLRAKNAEIIRTAPLGDWLPSMKDTHFVNGQAQTSDNILGGCQGFYDSPLGDGQGFISLVSLSLDDQSSLDSSTIVSRPGAVYASPDALYVAVRQYPDAGYGWYSGMDGVESASTIHKFDLLSNPARAEYAASGVVKGWVLNQFSMDEWHDHLRVATTSGHVPDPSVHSTISVLEEDKGALVETGRVDGIAPKEDIRSVRFAEDKGFIVTFKKTDPLYVFDLRDATAPRVLGELKIPGFSTYMHMMDDTHLLTIGYDADDQGSFAWFQGVLLQIFDVTNPTDPQLTHKEVIGTRGSSSEALTNHLAFNYFAPKNLLSFPITVCEGGSGGSYGTNMTFSGLMVYDVTAQAGFSLKGKVAHPTDPTTGGYDSSGCTNWWTQASSKVKRSIIMDDYVFSVSDSLIKVSSLNALSTDLAAIPIGD
jgi:hypothetical protein